MDDEENYDRNNLEIEIKYYTCEAVAPLFASYNLLTVIIGNPICLVHVSIIVSIETGSRTSSMSV